MIALYKLIPCLWFHALMISSIRQRQVSTGTRLYRYMAQGHRKWWRPPYWSKSLYLYK
jgi:hypothetical protein